MGTIFSDYTLIHFNPLMYDIILKIYFNSVLRLSCRLLNKPEMTEKEAFIYKTDVYDKQFKSKIMRPSLT